MADYNIVVSLSNLSATVQRKRECIKKLTSDCDNLHMQYINLKNNWEGPAGEDFAKRIYINERNLLSMIGQFTAIADYEEKAYKQYVAAENNVMSIVAGMK